MRCVAHVVFCAVRLVCARTLAAGAISLFDIAFFAKTGSVARLLVRGRPVSRRNLLAVHINSCFWQGAVSNRNRNNARSGRYHGIVLRCLWLAALPALRG